MNRNKKQNETQLWRTIYLKAEFPNELLDESWTWENEGNLLFLLKRNSEDSLTSSFTLTAISIFCENFPYVAKRGKWRLSF